MYGFSPAAFVPRHEDDVEAHETVEIEWLLAFWDYHVERVDGSEHVYDVTKHGLSTGTLMMSDDSADHYRNAYERGSGQWIKRVVTAKTRTLKASWSLHIPKPMLQDLEDELSRSLQQEIDREIMRSFRMTVTYPRAEIDMMRMLALAPRGENAVLTSESLRAQECLLRSYPQRTARAERLRACGFII